MQKLKVGVIGLGIQGELHLRTYSELPNTEVVGIADVNEERLKAMGNKYKVKGLYKDFNKMIAESGAEAISIATPDHFHREAAVASLRADKHTLVEKPLATSVHEADDILKTAAMSRAKLMTNYTHRWHPAYYQAYSTIKSGKIGKPVVGYARKNDTLYVATEMIKWADKSSPTMFLSAHDVDLIRWYFGGEANEVYATGIKQVLVKKGIDTYDAVQAQVRFDTGAVATFEATWIYPNTFPTIVDSFVEVIGTDGVIHLDRKSESIEVATHTAFQYPKTFLAGEIFGKLQGAFQLAVAHFVDCVINNKEPLISGKDGRQVTSILEAIHRSAKEGKPVKPE